MFLWIKGTPEDAQRKADQLGLSIHNLRHEKRPAFPYVEETFALTDDENFELVGKWFLENNKDSAPFPAGSLLYYRRGGYFDEKSEVAHA